VLEFWGKWEKHRKPQAWVKFVETLAPEVKDPKIWTFYEPNGGIFTIAVPPCLLMPANLFEVFVAREVHRAVSVAQGVAATELKTDETLDRWMTEQVENKVTKETV
jgi:hypothetical protein